MLLELQKVSKFFGKRCILKEVNLSLHGGTISLLTGANGAGKSTLLRIMAGLARPSFGKIKSHVHEKEVGYLGHATFVYPALTAQENLQFWANMYGLSAERTQSIDDVLKRVNLLPHAMQKASVFSRGMAQRLNLARVLMLEPKLWLLDEPSTGLDQDSSKILLQEVLAAKECGAGIVWISHDLEAHKKIADAVYHIEKGKLCQLNTSNESVEDKAC